MLIYSFFNILNCLPLKVWSNQVLQRYSTFNLIHNNTTLWPSLAGWDLPEFQVSWKPKIGLSVAINIESTPMEALWIFSLKRCCRQILLQFYPFVLYICCSNLNHIYLVLTCNAQVIIILVWVEESISLNILHILKRRSFEITIW